MTASKFTEAAANVSRELANVTLRALTAGGNVHPGSAIRRHDEDGRGLIAVYGFIEGAKTAPDRIHL